MGQLIVTSIYSHSYLPEKWSPADNTVVAPLIFVVCQLPGEGTVGNTGLVQL